MIRLVILDSPGFEVARHLLSIVECRHFEVVVFFYRSRFAVSTRLCRYSQSKLGSQPTTCSYSSASSGHKAAFFQHGRVSRLDGHNSAIGNLSGMLPSGNCPSAPGINAHDEKPF
jgi:hypothetical protein